MGAITYRFAEEKNPDSLQIKFKPCTRQPKEWKEEVYAAARSIANTAGKQIWVCFNGSMDSEVVCRAFFDQGIHFSVLTLEHVNGMNADDVKFTRQWCYLRNLEHKVERIDMQHFLEEEIKEYAKTYESFHPVRYFQIKQMEIVESLSGFAVMGGGERLIHAYPTSKRLSREDLFIRFAPGTLAPLQWCEDTHSHHEPYFFFSTPELCTAYLKHPLVALALREPELIFNNKRNIYLLKWIIYQSSWPDIETRTRFDGWEQSRQFVEPAVRYLKAKFGSEHTVNLSLADWEAQLAGKV